MIPWAIFLNPHHQQWGLRGHLHSAMSWVTRFKRRGRRSGLSTNGFLYQKMAEKIFSIHDMHVYCMSWHLGIFSSVVSGKSKPRPSFQIITIGAAENGKPVFVQKKKHKHISVHHPVTFINANCEEDSSVMRNIIRNQCQSNCLSCYNTGLFASLWKHHRSHLVTGGSILLALSDTQGNCLLPTLFKALLLVVRTTARLLSSVAASHIKQ